MGGFVEWVIPIINIVVRGGLPEKVPYLREEDFRRRDNKCKVLQKSKEPVWREQLREGVNDQP